MGFKCCVPNCKSGYKYKDASNAPPPGPPDLSFHAFPIDLGEKQNWKNAIPRADQEPNSNSKVCSLHFKASDFQIERKDTQLKYRKDKSRKEVKRKLLLPNSVPSNFPGLPQYYNKTIPDRRSESTSREARFQKQNDANEVEVEEFLAADKVSSLQELQEKTENDIPKGSEV